MDPEHTKPDSFGVGQAWRKMVKAEAWKDRGLASTMITALEVQKKEYDSGVNYKKLTWRLLHWNIIPSHNDWYLSDQLDPHEKPSCL